MTNCASLTPQRPNFDLDIDRLTTGYGHMTSGTSNNALLEYTNYYTTAANPTKAQNQPIDDDVLKV